MIKTRPDWDDYFLDIAEMVATRSTCLRLQVGSVLVSQDHRILSTGYNGSPKGVPHCIDDGCLKNQEGRCIRTVHAETNAIMSISPEQRKGAILYCTHEPCEHCTKTIVQSGVIRVVYRNSYPNPVNEYFRSFITWEHRPKAS